MHELVKSLQELEGRVATDPKAKTSVEGTVSVRYVHAPQPNAFNLTWTFDFPEGTVEVSRVYSKIHPVQKLIGDAVSYLQGFFDHRKYVITTGVVDGASQDINLRLTNPQDHKR
jgi:hypothetical protein